VTLPRVRIPLVPPFQKAPIWELFYFGNVRAKNPFPKATGFDCRVLRNRKTFIPNAKRKLQGRSAAESIPLVPQRSEGNQGSNAQRAVASKSFLPESGGGFCTPLGRRGVTAKFLRNAKHLYLTRSANCREVAKKPQSLPFRTIELPISRYRTIRFLMAL
jgi:hypothetical protein